MISMIDLMYGVLHALLLTLACASQSNFKDIAPKSCVSQCGPLFEDECSHGCAIAFALTHAPKSYKHTPTCLESCGDAYSTSVVQIAACNSGCIAFNPDNQKSNAPTDMISFIKGSLKDSIARFRSLAFGSPSFEESNFDEPKLVGHLSKLIFIQSDNGDDDDAPINVFANDEVHELDDAESNIHPLDKEAVLKTDKVEEPKNPQVAVPTAQSEESLSKNIYVALPQMKTASATPFLDDLRDFFSNPIKCLLFVSVLALVIMLIIQVFICIRRYKMPMGNNHVLLHDCDEVLKIKVPADAIDYFNSTSEKPQHEVNL